MVRLNDSTMPLLDTLILDCMGITSTNIFDILFLFPKLRLFSLTVENAISDTPSAV